MPILLVRLRGLEPPLNVKVQPEPESGASANFAITAYLNFSKVKTLY